MKFRDIKQFPYANYAVDTSWDYLEHAISRYMKEYNLDFDPIFQRGYVWTLEQQIAYIEYKFRGGMSGRDIFFNYPGFMSSRDELEGRMVLVDGKQRLNAALSFLRGEIPAFGLYFNQFEGRLPSSGAHGFKFHVNTLEDEREVVQWYIDFNTGGSAHTPADLKPAYEYLAKLNAERA